MNAVEAEVRAELVARRERLTGFARQRRDPHLVELLRRVDLALERLEAGGWGVCAACQVAIEPDLLTADPLVSVCLECLSLEERRSLARDLEGAARVQQTLLPPRRLAHDGWEVAWRREPRGPVSGDHVDLLVPREENEPLHLLVGDVSGKGVTASLLQAHLHALFRALVSPPLPLADLLGRATRLFAEATAAARYATLVALRLAADGTAEIANAGHPRPLLADRRGVRPVEGAGLPLGLFLEAEFPAHRLHVAPGEVLLLYSDGFTEAAVDGEEYGVGRAAAALRRAAGLPLDELLAAVRADLAAFLGPAGLDDDLTLLALRRTDDPRIVS